jgi:hypothetical protein
MKRIILTLMLVVMLVSLINILSALLEEEKSSSGRQINTDIDINVTTDKNIYLNTQPIRITITAVNPSEETVTLEFSSNVFTNYLLDADFNYLIDMNINILPVLSTVSIEPGCEVSWLMIHHPDYYPLLPGSHTITGILEGYGEDSIHIEISGNLAINEENMPGRPAAEIILSNYPNPFNPDTTIEFELTEPERVKISIFNARGELMRILTDDHYPGGKHTLLWNGSDSHGNTLPSGIYFSYLTYKGGSAANKMILLK